jgi:hypothetical protein
MKGLRLFAVGVCAILFWEGCSKKGGVRPPVTDSVWHADESPPVDHTLPSFTITWADSARKISHDVGYAEYGRVHRIHGDTLLLTYHCGRMTNGDVFYGEDLALRRSLDNGNTWSEVKLIAGSNEPDYYGFCNPETLVLNDGSILLAYAGRGRPDDNVHDNVQVRISRDAGNTWGPPVIVARGRSWEPDMVQLPDGVIDLFYSSEARWWPGNMVQQEILMVTSANNGATWSSPKTVAYTAGMRDGMPVPILLPQNEGIVFAIESVGNSRSPWILWSSLDANWNYEANGSLQNGRRWPAISGNIFGGAPYLIRLPAGGTVLSVQDGNGRGTDWKKSTMDVFAGNGTASRFTLLSSPWPGLPDNQGAYFSSLFLKDTATIVLVTTRSFADGHSEIWWKEGHINR